MDKWNLHSTSLSLANCPFAAIDLTRGQCFRVKPNYSQWLPGGNHMPEKVLTTLRQDTILTLALLTIHIHLDLNPQ